MNCCICSESLLYCTEEIVCTKCIDWLDENYTHNLSIEDCANKMVIVFNPEGETKFHLGK